MTRNTPDRPRFGTITTGDPRTLGATFDGNGTRFSVFSAHAERVELCLFDGTGKREVARVDLPDCTDEVWHGYLPGAMPGQRYGYRVHGPYEPEAGHRFNPHKLLIDPYARKLDGTLRHGPALHGYRLGSGRADLSFDRRDSAMSMPKGVVVDDNFRWRDSKRPDTPWSKTVVYETHVRGMTRQLDGVDTAQRGTFAALADPRVIEHLLKIGVTAVELLPIQSFLDDDYLVQKGLHNYWGYSTLSYFAPHAPYLSGGDANEIRRAVQALHDAGLEVIMDVVYNHTCEGSELGPTLSFRGLDNASYYRLAENPRHYINDTGCGNTLNTAHPRVLQLVLDSLRYWAQEFHIDGFRFDLGVSLGREPHGFDPDGRVFTAMRQDPVLGQLKLISEPWDIGPGGYQLGQHPPGMAEWNGRFRDDVRAFWRGESGKRGALAAALGGSADLFDRRRRKPAASVNFITAHDGFTLRDLVSYEQKHNEANGEDNNDGANDNLSNNWGVEGETDDAGVRETRERVARSLLGTLLLSQGTPMLLGGDEFWRTQNGNNNAYCQDNAISWFDWSLPETPEGRRMIDWVSRLTTLRAKHASLAAPDYLHGQAEPVPGLRDIDWFDESGEAMNEDAWQTSEAHLLALRRVVPVRGGADASLLLINGSGDDRDFALPQPATRWTRVLDSADPDAKHVAIDEASMSVAARSIVLLVSQVTA